MAAKKESSAAELREAPAVRRSPSPTPEPTAAQAATDLDAVDGVDEPPEETVTTPPAPSDATMSPAVVVVLVGIAIFVGAFFLVVPKPGAPDVEN